MAKHGSDAVARLALLVLTLLQAGLWGGEPAPAPGPEAQPKEETRPTDDQQFLFDPADRRDPFTFAKAIPTEPVVSSTGSGTSGDDRGPRNVLRPQEVDAKRREAEACYQDAEEDLAGTEAAGALAKCDKGLEVFREIPNIADYPQLQVCRESLFRLRKAAERLRQRQDADREFSRLSIKVTGVVAREKRSQAIINGTIVAKGDVVTHVGENNDAVIVDEILPEQVIFMFRGFKMPLFLSEIGR